MFPSAGATIYRNEDGEVLGWDEPMFDDAPEFDPYDYDGLDFPEDDQCPDDECMGNCDYDDCYGAPPHDVVAGAEDAWLDGSYEE